MDAHSNAPEAEEDLLLGTAMRVNKTIEPCRLQFTGRTLTSLEHALVSSQSGEGKELLSSLALIPPERRDECDWHCNPVSSRGERNGRNISSKTVQDVDAFLHESLLYLIEKEASMLRKQKEEETVLPALLNAKADVLTKHQEIPTHAHEQGMYDLGDLTFNLTPRRSMYITPYQSFTHDAEKLKVICRALDRQCSNGFGCYYRTKFFPHVKQPGPVALPKGGVEEIITDLLPAADNSQQIKILLEILYTNIFSWCPVVIDEHDQTQTTPTKLKQNPFGGGDVNMAGGVKDGKHYVEGQQGIELHPGATDNARYCIVCLLVENSAQQWRENANAKIQHRKAHNMYMFNHMSPSAVKTGFVTVPDVDMFDPQISVHSSGRAVQLKDYLDLSHYTIVDTDDASEWVVVKST